MRATRTPSNTSNLARVGFLGAITLGIIFFMFTQTKAWETGLRFLFPLEQNVLYGTAPLFTLALQHLALIFSSSLLTTILGVALGVFVTRESGKEFLPLVSNLTALAQTFPPVAVLALSYPILGFGFYPVLIALSLYGLLPILAGTLAGIGSVDPAALEAARGMGMTNWQVLTRVELPLALRPLLGGIRTSVVVNIGTAAIGAAIGAGGLGLPIFAGLENQNFAFVLEGALSVAILALWADWVLGTLERALIRG
jgi:osmoprotectant transport system permease protein